MNHLIKKSDTNFLVTPFFTFTCHFGVQHALNLFFEINLTQKFMQPRTHDSLCEVYNLFKNLTVNLDELDLEIISRNISTPSASCKNFATS